MSDISKETTFTPGPYSFEVEEYSPNYVRGPSGTILAHVVGDSAECDATAHLFAASYDLYWALKALEDRGHTEATWHMAKRALAKARGEDRSHEGK